MSTTSGLDLDVLIVGAGPTGLALALQLQRFGARFRIIDKLHDRGRESRALGVQARSLELLQLFGLGEALVARGNTSTRLKHVEGRAVVVGSLGDIGAADTRFPFILFVSQAETETVLTEHLNASGSVVERGVELTSCEASGGIECGLRHDDGTLERGRAQPQLGLAVSMSSTRSGDSLGGTLRLTR